jgi:hypothetical protein
MVLSGCAKNTDAETSPILAKVNDRIINQEDYLARAELTVRPDYCRGKGETDKQIVLNSLIAEKLLALEGEKDSVLTGNQSFQNYLLGIKEQAMRTKLLELEVEQKVEIPREELLAAVDDAGKQYKVLFMYNKSKDEIDNWKNAVEHSGNFEAVAEEIYGEKIPIKEVVWGEFEESLENAIYSDSVTVGSIVGPVKTTVGYYLIKVIDFKRTITPGQASTDAIVNKVKNTLKARKWRLDAANYVAEIMRGKEINLDPVGFSVLIEAYQPIYATSDDIEKQPDLEAEETAKLTKILTREINQNLDLPLLTIDDRTWSIADFVETLKTRPLMFRVKNMGEAEFPAYMKMAIKDLLRDKYLTDDAYKKNLDEDDYVRGVEQQWRDHMLAIGKRNQLLRESGLAQNGNPTTTDMLEALQPSLKEIAAKSEIETQWTQLDSLELTSIPWMALQSGNPYPQRVPPFPVLTQDWRKEFLIDSRSSASN